MWICLNDSFLSIVQYRMDRDLLLVRSRVKEHIERVFPGAEVVHTPDADYAFRAVIPRDEVAERIALEVLAVDYANFKNSVRDFDLHDAYSRVWGIMRTLQRKINRWWNITPRPSQGT